MLYLCCTGFTGDLLILNITPVCWHTKSGYVPAYLHNLVADQRLRDAFLAQSLVNWQVTAPGLFTCTGPFLVTELAYLGREEAEAGWQVTLASAGALSLTAAGG